MQAKGLSAFCDIQEYSRVSSLQNWQFPLRLQVYRFTSWNLRKPSTAHPNSHAVLPASLLVCKLEPAEACSKFHGSNPVGQAKTLPAHHHLLSSSTCCISVCLHTLLVTASIGVPFARFIDPTQCTQAFWGSEVAVLTHAQHGQRHSCYQGARRPR